MLQLQLLLLLLLPLHLLLLLLKPLDPHLQLLQLPLLGLQDGAEPGSLVTSRCQPLLQHSQLLLLQFVKVLLHSQLLRQLLLLCFSGGGLCSRSTSSHKQLRSDGRCCCRTEGRLCRWRLAVCRVLR